MVGVSPNAGFSGSPRNLATSPSGSSFTSAARTARQLQAFLPPAFPIPEGEEGTATPRTGAIKVLLLENISADAAAFLKRAGYEVSHNCHLFTLW
jgi:D-3-phosphoglycerate dehydrogenase